MNVRKFKEIVSKWDNYEENFKQFRIWENNCYAAYIKKYELAVRQAKEEDCNEKNKIIMDYEWLFIDYDAVVDLYNRMGWELDDSLKKMKMTLECDMESYFYNVMISNIHSKIVEINDDIEYAYAILILCKHVLDSRKLYKEYVQRVYEGIKEYDLTKCLEEIDDLERKTCFVAMWFDDKMKNARKKIVQAISKFNYYPVIIDTKEFNGQIVPEIYKEIEDSDLVVADLTGQRCGVYYEAGYAVAKGKPVIMCCQYAEHKKLHFDVAQINTIFWKDENDLYNRLVNRLKATVMKKTKGE